MSEIYVEIAPHHPIDIFGLEEEKLNRIRRYFPYLNIVLRGDLIKAIGDPAHLADFERKLKLVLFHFERFNRLTESDIDDILGDNGHRVDKESHQHAPQTTENEPSQTDHKPDAAANAEYGTEPLHPHSGNPLILIGANGKPIRALTENQQKIVSAIQKNDMVFAIGPAGTGKTYLSIALAVKALKEKRAKKIILSRPAVEAGEKLGFLPGDMKDKIDPYLQPLYDALEDMLPAVKLQDMMEKRVIQIAPLAFMRGRTLSDAVVILDEAQNTTTAQIRMFLTRMGWNTKMIITGDLTQVDLPHGTTSGLREAVTVLKDVEGISIVNMTDKDIVRHKLVTRIVKAFAEADNSVTSRQVFSADKQTSDKQTS